LQRLHCNSSTAASAAIAMTDMPPIFLVRRQSSAQAGFCRQIGFALRLAKSDRHRLHLRIGRA